MRGQEAASARRSGASKPRGRGARILALGRRGGGAWPGGAAAEDDLVISVAQFSASLHPDISTQPVQVYAIGFALRPLTAIDPQAPNICLLCTELPMLQNGLVPRLAFATASFPTGANNWSGQDWAGFGDPRTDADMAQAEMELDPARQKALWADMQRVYATDMPELPLSLRTDLDILPPWLKGYVATGREDYAALWAESWHS